MDWAIRQIHRERHIGMRHSEKRGNKFRISLLTGIKEVLLTFQKNLRIAEAPLLQSELHRRLQNTQTVNDTASEIDGRGLLKILCRTAHLANPVSKPDDLCQHLVVEDEIV